MKKIALFLIAAVAMFSCTDSKNSAVIDLNVANAGGKEIILSKLNVNAINIVDTLTLDNQGCAKYSVEVAAQEPGFYYLSYNRKRLASLLLKGGDKVAVSVDTLGKDLKIAGSEESVYLADVEKKMYDLTVKLDAVSAELLKAVEAKDKRAEEQLKREFNEVFIKYKRVAVVDIMKNPYSIVNINILYQNLGGSMPLFGELNDVAYFKRVHDSLVTVYPNSVYVKSLAADVDARFNVMALNSKMQEAEQLAFPEIALPDTQGKVQKMSALAGKPFILFFWMASNSEHKMYNHDLKEIYKKYNPKGLEIYQVCVDADKPMWATVVKEQQLPWINVCDGLGASSPVLGLYNITKVPAIYVFDKEGDIVSKDQFDKASLEKVIGKLKF